MAITMRFDPEYQLDLVLRHPSDEVKEMFLVNLNKHIIRNQELFIKELLAKLLGVSGVDFTKELRGRIAKMMMVNLENKLTDFEKAHVLYAFYNVLGKEFFRIFDCGVKEKLQLMYPVGTKLKLIKPLEDIYSPKEAGDVMTVTSIDDMGQIHGTWESGGSLAIIPERDSFEKIEKQENSSN